MYSACNTFFTFYIPVLYIHDSREESRDPIPNGLELIDHHGTLCGQVLAVLLPDDGGVQPGIGDIDGAVEFSFITL